MRTAELNRTTKETDIQLTLCLDGGPVHVNTGIGFFDHMLTAFAVHSGFGLSLEVKGDLKVDCHHTVEDVGIVLGQAFRKAVGENPAITRYGTFFVPMDESLAMCSLDISGRAYLVFLAEFAQERIGDFDSCMTEEFFRAFAFNAGITLHVKCPYGKNAHHQAEAMFKAAAHALKLAVQPVDGGVLSTKGSLSL